MRLRGPVERASDAGPPLSDFGRAKRLREAASADSGASAKRAKHAVEPEVQPRSRSARRRTQRKLRAALGPGPAAKASTPAKDAAAAGTATMSWSAAAAAVPGRLLRRSHIFPGRPMLARSVLVGMASHVPRVVFGLPHQRTASAFVPHRCHGPRVPMTDRGGRYRGLACSSSPMHGRSLQQGTEGARGRARAPARDGGATV